MKKKLFNWIAWLAIGQLVYSILINLIAPMLTSEVALYGFIMNTENLISLVLGYLVYNVSKLKFGKVAGGLIMAVAAFYILQSSLILACGEPGYVRPIIYNIIVDVIMIMASGVTGYCLWKEFQCKAAKLLLMGYSLSAVFSTLKMFILAVENAEDRIIYMSLFSILFLIPVIMKLIGWVTLRKQVAAE